MDGDWKDTTIGELCDLTDGSVQTGPFGSDLHASDYSEYGIPVIMPANLGKNQISEDGIARVANEHVERLKNHKVIKGDIVFPRRGDVARYVLIDERHIGWLCGTGCLRIRFGKNEIIDPKFLGYWLGTTTVEKWLLSNAVGTTMPNLNTSILKALPVPLPPLPEQRAIAHILGSLDDKIELNRRMNATLEATARALFQSWFVDFDPVHAKARGEQPSGMDAATADLFSSRFVDSPLGPIPEGWRVEPLSNLCKVARGSSPRPINDYMNGTVPWVKIADATAANGPFIFETKEKVKQEGVDKSVFLKKGSLIVSNSATTGLPIFLEIDGCIHDGWLYFTGLHSISQHHLYFVILTISAHLTAIADGTVQKNLNTALVGSQKIIVPDQKVSQSFEQIIFPVFEQMKSNGHESRTLAETRDALLPKLLSGEVRVSTPMERHNNFTI